MFGTKSGLFDFRISCSNSTTPHVGLQTSENLKIFRRCRVGLLPPNPVRGGEKGVEGEGTGKV